MLLTKAALWGLRKIYRRGYKYQKAGVMLSELVPADNKLQHDLFSKASIDHKARKLNEVMDQINNRMGSGTIKLASQGIRQSWAMRQANKSQNYTTDWHELLVVN